MSYSGLAAAESAGLPADVAPTFVHEMATPVDRRRGWVAVPTFDMREYVKTQIFTLAAGFAVGVSVGAVFGNVLAERNLEASIRKVVRNPPKRKRRTSRRTSKRKRPRGRPTGTTITDVLTVTMGGMPMTVTIDRGTVRARGREQGSVYDLGTRYQAIPIGGESRAFGTLAGAVKHTIRS